MTRDEFAMLQRLQLVLWPHARQQASVDHLEIVFELPPEERLAAALQTLGVDFANLSEVAGHA